MSEYMICNTVFGAEAQGNKVQSENTTNSI